MVFTITLKDPDGIEDSIRDAIDIYFNSLPDSMSQEEKITASRIREETVRDEISTWIRSGEYVTIEINTCDNTAIVRKT